MFVYILYKHWALIRIHFEKTRIGLQYGYQKGLDPIRESTVKRSGGLTTPGAPRPNSLWGPYTGGWNGVSKEIEDGCKPPTLRAGYPWNVLKAVSGVAQRQSIEGYGRAGPNHTLGSPWPPLAIHDTPMGPYYLQPYRLTGSSSSSARYKNAIKSRLIVRIKF
jgi:hypothetical protein